MATPTSSPVVSPTGSELGSSFGVMLVSTVITGVFLGFTLLQALYYLEHFPKDPRLLKITVAVLWILDVATVALDIHGLYFYLITNYGIPSALQNETQSLQVEMFITYTVVFIVQGFFILRMYHLRPHMWYIPAVLAVVALASYATVFGIFSQVLHDTSWKDTASPSLTRMIQANWVLGMIVDMSITIVLCWYLWSEKVSVRHKTNVMLNRIIIFMVNRGAIAAIVQVLTLATKLISPHTFIWLAFHNILAKVYTNSMLATLNARVALRKIIMNSEIDDTKAPDAPTVPIGKPPRQNHRITTLEFAPNRFSDADTMPTDLTDDQASCLSSPRTSHTPHFATKLHGTV